MVRQIERPSPCLYKTGTALKPVENPVEVFFFDPPRVVYEQFGRRARSAGTAAECDAFVGEFYGVDQVVDHLFEPLGVGVDADILVGKFEPQFDAGPHVQLLGSGRCRSERRYRRGRRS